MNSSEKQIIAIGSDHGGYQLKEKLKEYLTRNGFNVNDCGTFSTEDVDYPKFAYLTAKEVSDGNAHFGIIVDGAGIGSAMTANKVGGIRAALCYDVSSANNAREHNNANVLTLGSGLIGENLAKQICDKFLSVDCTVDRHLKRASMIDELDKGIIPFSAINASKTSNKKDNHPMELSSQDLTRIADRIREMLSTDVAEPKKHQSACGDANCNNCGHCAEKTPDTIRKYLDLGAGRISHKSGSGYIPKDIAGIIDHTILKPDATEDDIITLCNEAREHGFASVCVNPTFVSLARRELVGTDVQVCTVVGFPLGAHMSEIKSMETRRAIREGAREIDMVINIGALKSGKDDLVYDDIRKVVDACEDGGALSKIIIEAALLTDDEKIRACQLCKRARANYVKTSTGFAPGGATEKDVALMSSVVKDSGIGVKAAGGIKDYKDFEKMVSAGATRIGASAGIKIVQGAREVTVSN